MYSFLLLLGLALPAEAQNCNSIPNTLTNGTTADATPVMGNFTYLGGCTASIASPSFTGSMQVVAPSTSASGAFYGVNVSGAQSVASTGDYYGISTGPTYTASSGTLTTMEGIRSTPENTNTGTITSLYGIAAQPENTSSGTIGNIRGISTGPLNTGSGTITTMYGIVSTPQSTSTGTGAITNMYGVYTETEVNGAATITTMKPLYSNCINGSVSGSVTSCYELYLDTPTLTGPITTTYGVYQRYASAINYFAGDVEIGTAAAPSYLLQVGSSSASGIVLELQNFTAACTHSPATSAETVSCSSDARLKKDIVDAGPALPALADMRVRDFTVRATGERNTGVIAQEMLKAHRDMVHLGPDGFYKVDEPSPWKLVKAIQELRAVDDAQAQEIAALKIANAALAEQLNRRLSRMENRLATRTAQK
jgi:hypothetical protein